MATFDATIHPLAFAHMEGGLKTVFLVPNVEPFAHASSGDRVEFTDVGTITIGMVRRYPTLEEALEKEGFANVVPETTDLAEALAVLRSTSEWDDVKARAHGVLAFRVRSAKRKS